MRVMRSTSQPLPVTSLWSLWIMRVAQIAATGFLGLVAFAVLAAGCSTDVTPSASGTTRDLANKTSHSRTNGYEACVGHNYGRPGEVLINGVWVRCEDTEYMYSPQDESEEPFWDHVVLPEGELDAEVSTVTYFEGGGYDFLPFSLTEVPEWPVTVRFEALDPTEVALSDQAVVEIEVTADNYEMFGPNWRAPQDGIDDGDQTTQVLVTVISSVPYDPVYSNAENLIITVITVDKAPSIDDH